MRDREGAPGVGSDGMRDCDGALGVGSDGREIATAFAIRAGVV